MTPRRDVSWRTVAKWSGRDYHPLMQFARLPRAHDRRWATRSIH